MRLDLVSGFLEAPLGNTNNRSSSSAFMYSLQELANIRDAIGQDHGRCFLPRVRYALCGE